MVNTVGSFKINKFWNKKWIPIKSSLSLSNRQKSIIVGSLLGDGTMRVGERAKNANFKVEHGLRQKDLVFWKYQELKSFVFTKPKISFRFRDNGVKYSKSWWFRTIRHPELTEIYDMFYLGNGFKTGRKIIPNNNFFQSYFNTVALAILIMDDGSYNRGIIDISTYSFSLEDIERLRASLQLNFNLQSKYFKDRNKGYRMYFNSKNTKALIQIISPHIISSMIYKINFETP